MPARFELSQRRSGEFRFTLRSARGLALATSALYEHRSAALAAIRAVQRLAVDATVEDATTRVSGAAKRAGAGRSARGGGRKARPAEEEPVDENLAVWLEDPVEGEGGWEEPTLEPVLEPVMDWSDGSGDSGGGGGWGGDGRVDDTEDEAEWGSPGGRRRSSVRFRHPLPPGVLRGWDALGGVVGTTSMPQVKPWTALDGGLSGGGGEEEWQEQWTDDEWPDEEWSEEEDGLL